MRPRRSAWLCRVCSGEAKVFCFVPGGKPRRACSDACLDTIDIVLDHWGGEDMIQHNLTQMERVAIRSARQSLYEALVKIGRADAFNEASAEDMDSVIEAIWNGLRGSMQQQSARGEVPF